MTFSYKPEESFGTFVKKKAKRLLAPYFGYNLFLFAFFFNMPCLMALTATTQETHSMKWTVRIALYYVLTALIMATIAYHVGLVIF